MDFKTGKTSMKCRVCLGAVKKKDMSLFQHYKNLPLYSHIISIANVTIRENDGLPDKICSQCLQDLNTVISFKTKCEENDMILQTTTFTSMLQNASENETSILTNENEFKEPEEGNNIMSIGDNIGDWSLTLDGIDLKKIEDEINDIGDWSLTLDGIDLKIEDEIFIHLQTEDAETEKEDGQHFINNDQGSPNSEGAEDDNQNTSQIIDDTAKNYIDDDHDETLIKEHELKPVFKSKAIDLHLQCDDCKDFFKSKSELLVHWKKVHTPKQFICQTCKRAFKTHKSYHRHRKNKPKPCLEAANFRIERVGKSRIIYCKECSHKSTRMKDSISHRLIHTGEKPFTCDKCGKSHTQLSGLTAHKESAHGEYKVKITCQYCGKVIMGRNKAYKHLQRHTSQNVKCQICFKIFKNTKTLSVHMLRHEGKNKQCEFCELSFFTSAERQTHKRRVHLNSKYEYACDVCGYKSSRKLLLANHRLKHVGSKVACSQCGKFFDSAQKLRAHEQRHNAPKNYACEYCNMLFNRKDGMRSHIKRRHLLKIEPLAFEGRDTKTNKNPGLLQGWSDDELYSDS